ncbi:MAG: aspartate aminotransferase family protein [Balneolales bacterium]
MFKKSLHQIDQKSHFKLYKRFPVTLERGSGSRVWDVDGKEYIDTFAGIAVNSLGHSHPKIVAAIQDQASKLIHISNFFTSGPQVKLSEKLTRLTGLDRSFFTNSGVEAIEGAFKLARKYGHSNGKSGNIISMEECFHGRTIGAIAAGKKKYQEGFEPMPEGYQQVPFNDSKALAGAMDETTIAVVIEPVQGEGGIRVAGKAFLKEARRLCDKFNALLIFDEIQCGMGRTGTLFAYEAYGVKPDVLTLAKALGSGVPIGAVLATEKAASVLDYGNHGTTFGGNPLATRAALTTLEVMEEENLVQRSAELGEWLMKELKKIAKDEESITDVRGKGLMIGVELAFPGAGVMESMLKKGIIINVASGNVIRLVPPFIISKVELTAVVLALKEAIQEEKRKRKK